MSRSLAATLLTTRSPIRISPSLIASSPASMRSAVDLPQPDGPTRTMNSLSLISTLKSLTTVRSAANKVALEAEEHNKRDDHGKKCGRGQPLVALAEGVDEVRDGHSQR